MAWIFACNIRVVAVEISLKVNNFRHLHLRILTRVLLMGMTILPLFLVAPKLSATILFYRQPPAGLCVLMLEKQLLGHGFVAGKGLFTSAHVLEAKPDQVFCYNLSGELTDVTGALADVVDLHPGYVDPESWDSGIEFGSLSTQDKDGVLPLVKRLTDWGVVPLKVELESEYALDPSLSMGDSADFFDDIDAWRGPVVAGIYDSHESGLQAGWQKMEFGLLPAQMLVQPGVGDIRYLSRTNEPAMANLYFAFDIEGAPGLSGAPLAVYSLSQKKFIVIASFGGRMHGEARSESMWFAPSVPLVKWLDGKIPSALVTGDQVAAIRQVSKVACKAIFD